MKGRLFILAFASMTIMLGIVTNAWSQLPQSRLKNAGEDISCAVQSIGTSKCRDLAHEHVWRCHLQSEIWWILC
jgi:hypothetical protein